MIDFIIHTTQYIFIGFILAYFTGVIETLLHEIGHYITIKIVAKNTQEFTEKLKSFIIIKNVSPKASGVTKSNFLEFLSENPIKYKNKIRVIAIAGVLFTTLLYTTIIIITLVSEINNKIIIASFTIFYLIRAIIPFITGYKNTKSDLYIFIHPEEYKYL